MYWFVKVVNHFLTNIYGLGYQSLELGNIDSNGIDTNIYILGYNAGTGLTINCRDNDICNIYCFNTACDEITNIDCESVQPLEPIHTTYIHTTYEPSVSLTTTTVATQTIMTDTTVSGSNNIIMMITILTVSYSPFNIGNNTLGKFK